MPAAPCRSLVGRYTLAELGPRNQAIPVLIKVVDQKLDLVPAHPHSIVVQHTNQLLGAEHSASDEGMVTTERLRMRAKIVHLTPSARTCMRPCFLQVDVI